MPLLFADNFLAGAILTLVMPTLLLSAIAVWYVIEVKRVPEETPTSATTVPGPDVLAAGEAAAADAQDQTGAQPPAAAS